MVVPVRPPPLLPGSPARAHAGQVIITSFGFAAVGCLQMAVAFLVDPSVRGLLLAGLAIPGLLLVVQTARAYKAEAAASRRERAAGYTTLYGRQYADLWQLDADTGEVIHRPGEPTVESSEWRRRKRG